MPPTPRRSWLILGVAAYGQFGFSMFILGMGAVAPLVQQQFGLSLTQTGVVLAASNIGPVLCLVAWGIINDRWDEGRALTAGLCGAAAALVAVSFVTSFVALCVAILVASGLGSTANVSTGRAVMSAFQPPVRGLALGLRQTASPLGGALAGFALPSLAARSGVGDAFLLMAAVIAAGAGAAALWLRPRIALTRPVPLTALPVPPPARYHDPRIWRLGIASGILLAPQAVVVGLTAVMLTDGRGVAAMTAGAVLGAMQLVGAVLRVLLGYWAERWGSPVRTLRWMCLAIAAGTVVIGLCFGAEIWVTIAVVVTFGSLAMSWNSLSMGLVGDYGGDARSGYALGLHGTMLFVAAAVAVPMFTGMVEATSWRSGFLLLASCPLAAWFLLRKLPDPLGTLP